MLRSAPIFLLLLGSLLFGCTSAPITPVPVPTTSSAKSGTLRYFQLTNPDLRDVPMDMALRQLRTMGYTVETVQLENSTLIAEALARGDADVGQINNQTAWAAAHQGAKLRTIAAPVAGTGIIAAAKSTTDCAQLDGKPLALPVAKGVNPTLLDQYLTQKCGGAKPQIIIVPDIKARFVGLQNGTLAASLMQRDDLIELDKQAPSKFGLLIPLNQAFPNVVVNALQVNTNFATAHPALVHDLLYALVQANRQAAANPQSIIDDGVNRLGLEPAFAKASVEGNLRDNLWDLNGGLTREKVQSTLDFLIGLQSLPAGIKADEVADLSYLNTVLDELGRK